MKRAGEPSAATGDSGVVALQGLASRIRDALGGLDAESARNFLSDLDQLEERGGVSAEALASLLMEVFARTRSIDVFSLLYEVTHRQILLVVLKRLRYAHPAIDPTDVLQDVFLSIYRYPHRFRNEKASSFRNWSFSIVRNTLLKHMRNLQRSEVELDPIEEVVEDPQARAPLQELERDEEAGRLSTTYALCLLAYRHSFDAALKDREKRALHLIEVRGMKYRMAATRMEVRLENLKMIVCRARKKLLRAMADALEVRTT